MERKYTAFFNCRVYKATCPVGDPLIGKTSRNPSSLSLIIKQDIFPFLGILLIIDDDIVSCAMTGGAEPVAIEDCLPAFLAPRSILVMKNNREHFSNYHC